MSNYLSQYYIQYNKLINNTNELNYLKYINNNRDDKIKNNINKILLNINKLKSGSNKKYQISGYYEYNIIIDLIKNDKTILYKFINDESIKKNKLINIYGRTNNIKLVCPFNCMICDNSKMLFHNKLIPVSYINIFKK
jgi:hypothetical protein